MKRGRQFVFDTSVTYLLVCSLTDKVLSFSYLLILIYVARLDYQHLMLHHTPPMIATEQLHIGMDGAPTCVRLQSTTLERLEQPPNLVARLFEDEAISVLFERYCRPKLSRSSQVAYCGDHVWQESRLSNFSI